MATGFFTIMSSTLFPVVFTAKKVPPSTLALPGPVPTQVTPPHGRRMYRGIQGIKTVDPSQMAGADIIHLVVILPLKPDTVAVQTQMAVSIYKSRIYILPAAS